MIKKMLTFNPEERVRADQVINDEWIRTFGKNGKKDSAQFD
jgi:hypothetical protein